MGVSSDLFSDGLVRQVIEEKINLALEVYVMFPLVKLFILKSETKHKRDVTIFYDMT